MAKKVHKSIVSGVEGWDAEAQDNIDLLNNFPQPVASKADLATIAADFTLTENQEAVVLALSPFGLYLIDDQGTPALKRVGRPDYGTAQIDQRIYDHNGSGGGKFVLEKSFHVVGLANVATKSVAHGISGLNLAKGNYMHVHGTAQSGTVNRALPHPGISGSDAIEVTVDGTNINFICQANESATDAFLTLRYTLT